MDEQRFDDLTRAMARGASSRRGFLKAAIGGVIGAVTAGVTGQVDRAEAQFPDKPTKDEVECGTCLAICGAVAAVGCIGSDAICRRVPFIPRGKCTGAYIALCEAAIQIGVGAGACQEACAQADRCCFEGQVTCGKKGRCYYPDCEDCDPRSGEFVDICRGNTCCRGICCEGDEFCCGGQCVSDVEFNDEYCGEQCSNCTNVLSGGTPQNPLRCCEGACTNFLTDPRNCGGCARGDASRICESGECCNGTCCGADQKCCDGQCVSRNDPRYCTGGCNPCPQAEQCCGGSCIPDAFVCCDNGEVCGPGEFCCGQDACCGTGQACTEDGRCVENPICDADNPCTRTCQTCNPVSSTCVSCEEAGLVCCGNTCVAADACCNGLVCGDGQTCCGTVCIDDAGEFCCNPIAGYSCQTGTTCCGDTCCPIGQSCVDGVCGTITPGTCDPPCEFCETCDPATNTCVSCETVGRVCCEYTDSEGCAFETDCCGGGANSNGVYCPASAICCDGGYCCYAGTTCNNAQGRCTRLCVPACGSEEVCDDGTCRPAPRPCATDMNCRTGERCNVFSQICEPDPDYCDPPCSATQICIGRVCATRSDFCDPPCSVGETCFDNQCGSDPNYCDPPCPTGSSCSFGFCYRDPNYCDPPCPTGSSCLFGTCEPQVRLCTLEEVQCLPGEICDPFTLTCQPEPNAAGFVR